MAGRDAGRYHNIVAVPRGTRGARHFHLYESPLVSERIHEAVHSINVTVQSRGVQMVIASGAKQ